jgi:DNA-binding NarL/FixJ family response regulator
MALTLVLADDHQIVRQGLRAILAAEPDLQLVGEAGDGPGALRLIEQLRPQVVVLDLMLPGLNGLDVTREAMRRVPGTRIVILSMHANESYAAEALRAGASAYVLKEAGVAELLTAIREAAAGRRYLSPPLSEQALAAYQHRAASRPFDAYETLTTREREVLQLTAEGHSGAEIGRRLFISPRTVETHRMNLMRKLSLRNQKELVRYAVERGLVKGDR